MVGSEGTNKLAALAPQRVVILRALQLGDLLCMVPALRALRRALPQAQLTLIGLPWSQEFVRRFNFYLDDFIEFPGYPGLPERTPQIEHIPHFLTEVQRRRFDLALQMHGSGSIVNPLVELFGARLTAGYYLPGEYCPDEDFYLVYPDQEPEVRRHLRLVEHLGAPPQGDALEFPLYAQDWAEYQALASQYQLQASRYVCVHPGSRASERRWPAERFAHVADEIARRGFQVVLTGTRDEASITQEVAAQMQCSPVDLTGRTSLGTIGALLSGARLLVSNDTGVSHIAAALLTPSVVLFSDSEPERWAPLNRSLHRIIPSAGIAQPEDVLEQVDALLKQERVYAH